MTSGGLFDLDVKRERIRELELEMADPAFWEDQEKAQKLIDENNSLKSYVEGFDSLESSLENLEVVMLVSKPCDQNYGVLELHAGAGGTEVQEWVSILLLMYQRWAERENFTSETLDYLPGDEAGVKSVTLWIKRHNAYGNLKA